jgi:hypothetical protein
MAKGFARIALSLGGLLWLSAPAVRATEIIGPFEVVLAPVSATLVQGNNPTGGCSTVNTPIGVDAAFSGSPIIDDGFCNLAPGTTIQVDFGTGIPNLAGDDLPLLDARFSVNDYAVSTDWDGFTAMLALPGSNGIDTGEVRTYYYDNQPATSTAHVIEQPFDLSDLSVPREGW